MINPDIPLHEIGKIPNGLIVDSGCTEPMTPNKSDFITYEPVKHPVKGAGGNLMAIGQGTLRFHAYDHRADEIIQIDVPNALHVPGLHVRLLSVRSLMETGFAVDFLNNVITNEKAFRHESTSCDNI